MNKTRNLSSVFKFYFAFSALMLMICFNAFAVQVKGKVTDANGKALAFSSVYIKGSTKGTVANNDGQYFLDLPSGKYTVVCAHVGFQKKETTVELGTTAITADFTLLE